MTAVLRNSRFRSIAAEPLPWGDQDRGRFRAAVRRNLDRLGAGFGAGDQTDADGIGAGGDWAIFWCAGASVTGASEASVQRELDDLDDALDEIREWVGTQVSGRAQRGELFYVSSAGGVFAGSVGPPFTEHSAPAPLSPYGRGKLGAESRVTSFAAEMGVRALIGRVANLYGPAQSLAKAQGLITHLAKAQLSPTPASIYVPLETTRDYIFASDAAAIIRDAMVRLADTATPGETVIKIVASNQSTTIAELLGHFSVLSKSHPNVMLGASSAAGYQAVDLRVKSVVWPDIDRRPLVSLPEGIHSVLAQMMQSVQGGEIIR